MAYELRPPSVPDELADEMDRWIDLLHGLWSAWASVGRQGRLGAIPGSPVALKDARAADEQPHWGPGLVVDASMQAAQLVDAAAQHVLGVASLYAARQVVLAPWPVVRAELEHISRAAWILDPAASGAQQVARCWLERLQSLHQRRLALSAIGAPASTVKSAKRDRERARDEIERLFPGSATKPHQPDREPEWLVGGERLVSLGRGLSAFAGQHLNSPRLYDVLSLVSHPSVAELLLIAPQVPVSGYRAHVYVASPESVVRLAALAAGALYRGAWICCSAFGFDGTALDEWVHAAGEAAPELFMEASEPPASDR